MRTATLITTRLTLLRLGLPALIALVFAFGALTSASAAQSADALPVAGSAPADNHEADGDTPDTDNGDSDEGAGQARKLARLSDVEAVLALCSGDGDAPAFDNPSIGILCDVYSRLGGVLPAEVMRGLARAIAVHADQVAHGWRDRLADSDVATRIRARNATQLCRRVLHDALDGDDAGSDASTDAADGLLARCRAFLTGDGADDASLSAAEICTLLADSGVLDRSPSLAKRCRAAVGGGDQDGDAASARVCIRLREAGAAEDHPVLARRCHEFFSSVDDDGGDGDSDSAPTAQACIRLREAGTAADHPALAKACQRLASGHADGGDNDGGDDDGGDDDDDPDHDGPDDDPDHDDGLDDDDGDSDEDESTDH